MTTPEPGPIARKLIAESLSLRAGKVLDLAAFRESQKRMQEMGEHRAARGKTPPEFAAYADGSELAMHLLGATREIRELRPLERLMRELEETYMPSFPPMSPVTDSRASAATSRTWRRRSVAT